MKFNQYPESVPNNNQRIIYFLGSAISSIGTFKDDIDDWTGNKATWIEGNNCFIELADRKFFWVAYSEFWDTIGNENN